MPSDLYVNKVMKWREQGVHDHLTQNQSYPRAFKAANQSDRFCWVCKKAIVGKPVNIDLPDGAAVQAHPRCLEILAQELVDRGMLDIPSEAKPEHYKGEDQSGVNAALQLKVGKPRPEMQAKGARLMRKAITDLAPAELAVLAELLGVVSKADPVPDGKATAVPDGKTVTMPNGEKVAAEDFARGRW